MVMRILSSERRLLDLSAGVVCLDTAYRIKNGDTESWYKEWNWTAARLEKTADEFLSRGHKVSARKAYLLASNYYRNAGFYQDIDPGDARNFFLKAASLSDNLIEPVNPFENTTLPGYLYLNL
jgi:hypothetical protein